MEGGLADINSAIKIESNIASFYKNRAFIFYKLGKNEMSIRDLQKTAEIFEAQGDKASEREAREVIEKVRKLGK